jgi:hypothetical protein
MIKLNDGNSTKPIIKPIKIEIIFNSNDTASTNTRKVSIGVCIKANSIPIVVAMANLYGVDIYISDFKIFLILLNIVNTCPSTFYEEIMF